MYFYSLIPCFLLKSVPTCPRGMMFSLEYVQDLKANSNPDKE